LNIRRKKSAKMSIFSSLEEKKNNNNPSDYSERSEANNKKLYCNNDVFKTQIRYMIILRHSKIRNHKQYSSQKIKFKHWLISCELRIQYEHIEGFLLHFYLGKHLNVCSDHFLLCIFYWLCNLRQGESLLRGMIPHHPLI
jgi:hypothetical protein